MHAGQLRQPACTPGMVGNSPRGMQVIIYIKYADGPIPEIVWAPRRCAIATGNRMFHYIDYIPQGISPFRSMVASNNRKLI